MLREKNGWGLIAVQETLKKLQWLHRKFQFSLSGLDVGQSWTESIVQKSTHPRERIARPWRNTTRANSMLAANMAAER